MEQKSCDVHFSEAGLNVYMHADTKAAHINSILSGTDQTQCN